MPFRIALASLVLLLASVPASAGWKLTYTLTPADAEPQTVEAMLDEDHLRVSSADQPYEIILDSDGFTALDHGEKTVMTMTYDQLETMFGGMASMMSAMEEAQKKAMEQVEGEMTPEEREAFQKKMDAERNKVTLRPGDEKLSVAGMETHQILVLEDGREIGHMFVTGEIPIDFFARTADRLTGIIPESMLEREEEMGMALGLLEGIDGFPLKLVSEKHGEEMVVVATEVKEIDFDGEAWAAPAGYKKQSFPFAGMGGARKDEGGW